MRAVYPRLTDKKLAALPEVVRDLIETDRKLDDLLRPDVIPLDAYFRAEFVKLRDRKAENRLSAAARYDRKADSE